MLDKNDVIKAAEDLNAIAAKLLPMPDNLEQPEQLLYKSLCLTYREYRSGIIDLKQAKHDKQELVQAYINAKYDYALHQCHARILNAFQHKQDKIHKSGCEVCRELNDILCGLGIENAPEIKEE